MRKGKSIYHCHGKKKGKLLKTYESVEKAKEVHGAIIANKKTKKSGRRKA